MSRVSAMIGVPASYIPRNFAADSSSTHLTRLTAPHPRSAAHQPLNHRSRSSSSISSTRVDSIDSETASCQRHGNDTARSSSVIDQTLIADCATEVAACQLVWETNELQSVASGSGRILGVFCGHDRTQYLGFTARILLGDGWEFTFSGGVVEFIDDEQLRGDSVRPHYVE